MPGLLQLGFNSLQEAGNPDKFHMWLLWYRSSCGGRNVGGGREHAAQRQKKPDREMRWRHGRHPVKNKVNLIKTALAHDLPTIPGRVKGTPSSVFLGLLRSTSVEHVQGWWWHAAHTGQHKQSFQKRRIAEAHQTGQNTCAFVCVRTCAHVLPFREGAP